MKTVSATSRFGTKSALIAGLHCVACAAPEPENGYHVDEVSSVFSSDTQQSLKEQADLVINAFPHLSDFMHKETFELSNIEPATKELEGMNLSRYQPRQIFSLEGKDTWIDFLWCDDFDKLAPVKRRKLEGLWQVCRTVGGTHLKELEGKFVYVDNHNQLNLLTKSEDSSDLVIKATRLPNTLWTGKCECVGPYVCLGKLQLDTELFRLYHKKNAIKYASMVDQKKWPSQLIKNGQNVDPFTLPLMHDAPRIFEKQEASFTVPRHQIELSFNPARANEKHCYDVVDM